MNTGKGWITTALGVVVGAGLCQVATVREAIATTVANVKTVAGSVVSLDPNVIAPVNTHKAVFTVAAEYAAQPYSVETGIELAAGTTGSFIVPTGERFVVEDMSGQVYLNGSNLLSSLVVQGGTTGVAATEHFANLGTTSTFTTPSGYIYSFHEASHFALDGSVNINLQGSFSPGDYAAVTLSGYLVSIPLPSR